MTRAYNMMSKPSSIHPSEAASKPRLAVGVPSRSHWNSPVEVVPALAPDGDVRVVESINMYRTANGKITKIKSGRFSDRFERR